MKNPWLLSLFPLLLAVSLPVTAARGAEAGIVVVDELPLSITGASYHGCGGGGRVYGANSTYQANLRRAAVLLVAEATANPGSYYATHSVGYWPNRLVATSFCRLRDDGTGQSCAACIAGAFLELERACPFHREAFFRSRNCTLLLDEFRILGTRGIFEVRNILNQVMVSGLIFQAIGFAWLFYLLVQDWRSRKRDTLMHSTPLLSGD